MGEEKNVLNIRKKGSTLKASLTINEENITDNKELSNELQLLSEAYSLFIHYQGVRIEEKAEISDETFYRVYLGNSNREQEWTAAVNSGFTANIQRVLIQGLGSFIYNQILPKRIQDVLTGINNPMHFALNVERDLSWIPWELIFNGRKFLSSTFSLGRIKPEMMHRIAQRKGNKIRFLLVYNPTGDLFATESEANYLTSRLMGLRNVSLYRRGQEIRSNSFMNMVGHEGFDAIHYAGHAEFDPDELSKSSFIFKDARCYTDQLLSSMSTIPKIFFVDGCTSAMGPFPYELLNKGSFYIGTLWPVSDKPAGDFASNFYRLVLRGETLGNAIKQARVNSFQRLKYSDLTWAAYVLYGDPTERLFT
jgi:CHAT domain-containing protein